MRRWYLFSPLIPRRHLYSHSQRRCLRHTSSSIYEDRRVYSVPHFQPGIDPFIGDSSRNEKMPVHRTPCICSPIHPGNTTSMARGPSAKPPHPSSFGIAKRRTSSRYQSKGRTLHNSNTVMLVVLECTYRKSRSFLDIWFLIIWVHQHWFPYRMYNFFWI